MSKENINVVALSIWSFGHFLSVKKLCLLVVLGWFVSPCFQCKTSYRKYNKIGRVIQK